MCFASRRYSDILKERVPWNQYLIFVETPNRWQVWLPISGWDSNTIRIPEIGRNSKEKSELVKNMRICANINPRTSVPVIGTLITAARRSGPDITRTHPYVGGPAVPSLHGPPDATNAIRLEFDKAVSSGPRWWIVPIVFFCRAVNPLMSNDYISHLRARPLTGETNLISGGAEPLHSRSGRTPSIIRRCAAMPSRRRLMSFATSTDGGPGGGATATATDRRVTVATRSGAPAADGSA